MVRLIFATAEGTKMAALGPKNTIGRHPKNTIQLLDKIVAQEHCIIELRGSEWIVRDLGALNGTYVNGERIRGEERLAHGDEIALGATRIRFDDGSGALEPRAMPIVPGVVFSTLKPADKPN